MLSYQFGIALIVISILSHLWRFYRLKNTVEVDALVLSTGESKWPSETGPDYYAIFQYVVDGKEYVIRCNTGSTQYYTGTLASVYCSKGFFSNDYSNVTVRDTLGFHLFLNIVFLVSGVFITCYFIIIK